MTQAEERPNSDADDMTDDRSASDGDGAPPAQTSPVRGRDIAALAAGPLCFLLIVLLPAPAEMSPAA